jgi:allantoinase
VRATADRDLPMFAAVLASNVARRFRLDQRKGLLAEGKDADFTLLAYGPAHEIQADELWTRHLLSPYVGRRSRARLTHTFVRGQPVWAEGRPVSPPPPGQFLRPDH